MMSCRISLSLLRNYNHNLRSFNSAIRFKHLLSTSLPILNVALRLSSPAVSENVQLSKVLQPLVQNPIEGLLSAVDEEFLSGSESVMLLKSFRYQVLFKGVDSKSFKHDKRFQMLCKVFEKHCHQMQPSLLISGLRSLLEVEMHPNSLCVVSAEKVIIENVYQFSALNLIGCLYYHYKFVDTNLQKEVVALLINEIQNRLYEVANPAEVLMLIHIYHLFDDEHKKKIEQKIIELVPVLNVHDINKAICALAETSNRNIYILNVLVFYLRQKTERPDCKKTLDLFYAFKKLNFFDPRLYSYLLHHLESEIPSIKQPSIISGFLTTCGHLRWKHTGILDAFGLWIKTHLDICRTREFVAYVLGVGALNHVSPQTKSTLNLVLPHLTLEKVESPIVFLDTVWSLSVLDCVPKELLLQVLSKEFYKSLLNKSNSQVSSSMQLKLLNLKGVLKSKYPEFIFGCDLFLEPFKLPESTLIESSRKHVIKVLSNFVPMNKCLSVNQVSDMGVFIDAEFIMDQNMKPLSLQEYGVNSKATTFSKPLPKGCKRIALLVMFHKDFTAFYRSLTGVNALGARLLTDEGYTVVHIAYDKFSENKTEVEKTKYLLQKMKEHVISS